LALGVVTDHPEEIASLLHAGLPEVSFDNSAFEPAVKNNYLGSILSFIYPK